MSLPFGSGIGRYAENMSIWVANHQRWHDEARDWLIQQGLSDRYDQICGFDDVASVFMVQHASIEGEADESQQLAILMLAMAHGIQFSCDGNEHANGWISFFARTLDEEADGTIHHFLFQHEIDKLKELNLLGGICDD